MRTNCPNCGAVMNGELYKCPYCGTQYIDFATIQADGAPTVLRIKTKEGAIMMVNTILTKIDTNNEFVSTKTQNSAISNQTVIETTTILQSLGYNPKEYNSALETAISQMTKDDSQELLKEVLKILSIFYCYLGHVVKIN